MLDLKCFPQASGRPKRYDSAKNRVLRLTSEVKKSGPFGSATHVGGRRPGAVGGRGAAQTQARQDCEQRLGVRRRPASPSSFARSYRHTPDPPPHQERAPLSSFT